MTAKRANSLLSLLVLLSPTWTILRPTLSSTARRTRSKSPSRSLTTCSSKRSTLLPTAIRPLPHLHPHRPFPRLPSPPSPRLHRPRLTPRRAQCLFLPMSFSPPSLPHRLARHRRPLLLASTQRTARRRSRRWDSTSSQSNRSRTGMTRRRRLLHRQALRRLTWLRRPSWPCRPLPSSRPSLHRPWRLRRVPRLLCRAPRPSPAQVVDFEGGFSVIRPWLLASYSLLFACAHLPVSTDTSNLSLL